MKKGWLKLVLEKATADYATWPAWQRGVSTPEAKVACDHCIRLSQSCCPIAYKLRGY